MSSRIKPGGDARYPQLDVLRGVAIVLVLFHHTQVEWRDVGVMGPVCYFFRWVGWSGVDLFFVLSGFLIGGLLFREIQRYERLDIRRFIIRRAFKIWPPYFALIAYSAVKLIRHGSDMKNALWQIAPNLIHIQNYVSHVMGHTWSLAVEEHFYLALPILLWAAIRVQRETVRDSIPAVPIAAAALAVFCLALRCYRILWLKDLRNPTFPTEVRMDSLFFGVFCGYVFHFRPDWMGWVRRWRSWLMGGGALLALTALTASETYRLTLGFTCMYLGYGAILMGMMATEGAGRSRKTFLAWPGKALALIGVFSYAIYLWHLDLASWPVEHWYQMRWQRITGAGMYSAFLATYLAAALTAGVVMTLIVERPALWMRDRWWPARARTATAQVASVPAALGAERELTVQG